MTPDPHAHLAETAREAVKNLWQPHFPLSESTLAQLRFHGEAPSFSSPHQLTLASASAIAAWAVGAQAFWALMHGRTQSVAIDWMQAACALNPGQFQKQNGYRIPVLTLLSHFKADFYRTRDERWFFPVPGAHPHLRDGILSLLQCANTAEDVADAIATWDADELEEAFAARHLPGCYARSRQEWDLHPQGQWLAQRPVIEVERIGDSAPETPLPGPRPLSGIRVLDLGHVISGPVVARTLAEQGAQVLRVSSPTRQDSVPLSLDTNQGKRSAFLDLKTAHDLAHARELMATSDVVVQSWRPGRTDELGIGPLDAAQLRPGVIYVSVSAFGGYGPWGMRPGFEQLGQVASGIAVNEGINGKPRLVPTYLLNDYVTGYLGAAGVMMAMLRRAEEGGSWHVRVNLASTSMWTQDLGLINSYSPSASPAHFADALAPILQSRQSAFGRLTQLGPVAQFSRTLSRWDLPSPPIGSDLPWWED